jgi:hypothetical protein
MRTREELLETLIEIAKDGHSDHTGAVNGIHYLLEAEAKAEPEAEWVKKYKKMCEGLS